MTNEEAIELLENLKVCRQAHLLFNVEKEAVDMAVNALRKVGTMKDVFKSKRLLSAESF